MNIHYRTVSHPNLKNKEITLIYLNEELDLSSARFLIYEANYGGRNGSPAAKSSSKNRAIKIGELYRHLDAMNKTWKNALEIDIKMIRNAMLCWDSNGNEALTDYEYKPITHNVMNSKIAMWFKFYKYMNKIGEDFNMIMTVKKVHVLRNRGMLFHVNTSSNVVNVWALRITLDPIKDTYHALTKLEYYFFEKELAKIDIVYAMISHVLIETGLRIQAVLELKEDIFRGYFIHINKGKSIDESNKPYKRNYIDMEYINKGGNKKICRLPIRAVVNVKQNYLSRIHSKRLKLHSDIYGHNVKKFDSHAMWITDKGRKVYYGDILKAFKQASLGIGFTLNTVTPHWTRHTFVTWALVDYFRKNNIAFQNTGVEADEMTLGIIQNLIGHASIESTRIYTKTAFMMMDAATGSGPIMSFRTFKNDLRAHEIVKYMAMEELKDDFDLKQFCPIKYAISRGITVNDG